MRTKVFITGINGKLSNYIISFLATKYNIIGCDIHDKFLNDKYDVTYYQSDLKSLKSTESMLLRIEKDGNIPNILINNAAIDSVPNNGNISTDINIDSFDDYFHVNVRAPILISDFFCKKLISDKMWGKIINISSVYSIVSPDPNIYRKGFIKNILYGSSKSALNSITKQMSVIYSKNRITINSVIFSGIENIDHDKTFKNNYKKRIPIGRFMRIKEVKSVFNFLLDKDNTYTTGSLFSVDGGYTSI